MKKNRIILYPHGGSGNHGCEAIVRSTHIILGVDMTLTSFRPDEDYKYGLDTYCSIIPYRNNIPKNIKYLWAAIKYHSKLDKHAFDKLTFSNLINVARSCDFALSIGGDNYCYGIPSDIMLINRELKREKIPHILWGCSIEPATLSTSIIKDLTSYAFIVARESITYRALLDSGITNVILAPDPAFLLPVNKVELPDSWAVGDTIGLNISPMILDYSSDSDLTLRNYEKLIEYILSNTNSAIALIPHVEWSISDDRKSIRTLFDKYKHTGRIFEIQPSDACTLKGYISKCKYLIEARTHASIAAYSTGVPTLVMGYSVKAKGIATDLFGTYDNYVIPVQSLAQEEALTDAFKWLQNHDAYIRQRYKTFLPGYISQLHNLKALIYDSLKLNS